MKKRSGQAALEDMSGIGGAGASYMHTDEISVADHH